MKHMLWVALLVGAGCGSENWGSETKDKTDTALDAGIDVLIEEDATSVDMEPDLLPEPDDLSFYILVDGERVPIDHGGELEVVNGFQGGWHFKLNIGHDHQDVTTFDGTQTYKITAGNRVFHWESFEINELFFEQEGAEMVNDLPIRILEIIELGEIVGQQIKVEATYEFDDGTTLGGTLNVTVVDNIDEFFQSG